MLFTIDHLRSISFFCQNAHHDWLTKECISNWFLVKGNAYTVSPILSDIFNLSLSIGRIPDAWKLSRVVPVFKSGDPHTASNYRPISLQPICCKLLEKVIHGSVLQHLYSNNILSDRQFGFLPKSSTTGALTTALHEWYGHLEGCHGPL